MKETNIILYGKHVCLAALQNPARESIVLYITSKILEEMKEALDKLSKKRYSIKIVDRDFIDRLVGKDKNHQSMALMVKKLPEIDLYQILNQTKHQKNSIILCLDEVNDPQNVGAILRNAAAFNVDAVILTRHNSPTESAAIARAASGAMDIVPMVTIVNLAASLEILKKQDYWCYGLSLNHKNKETMSKIKFSEKTVLVLGSEHSGLRKLTNEKIDFAAYIPIVNIDSLNVSASSAIALYEINRSFT